MANWYCPQCTYENPPTYLCCEVCGASKVGTAPKTTLPSFAVSAPAAPSFSRFAAPFAPAAALPPPPPPSGEVDAVDEFFSSFTEDERSLYNLQPASDPVADSSAFDFGWGPLFPSSQSAPLQPQQQLPVAPHATLQPPPSSAGPRGWGAPTFPVAHSSQHLHLQQQQQQREQLRREAEELQARQEILLRQQALALEEQALLQRQREAASMKLIMQQQQQQQEQQMEFLRQQHATAEKQKRMAMARETEEMRRQEEMEEQLRREAEAYDPYGDDDSDDDDVNSNRDRGVSEDDDGWEREPSDRKAAAPPSSNALRPGGILSSKSYLSSFASTPVFKPASVPTAGKEKKAAKEEKQVKVVAGSRVVVGGAGLIAAAPAPLPPPAPAKVKAERQVLGTTTNGVTRQQIIYPPAPPKKEKPAPAPAPPPVAGAGKKALQKAKQAEKDALIVALSPEQKALVEKVSARLKKGPAEALRNLCTQGDAGSGLGCDYEDVGTLLDVLEEVWGRMKIAHRPDGMLVSSMEKGAVPHNVVKPRNGKGNIMFNSVSALRRLMIDEGFPMCAFDEM